jgi:hypothetical protein
MVVCIPLSLNLIVHNQEEIFKIQHDILVPISYMSHDLCYDAVLTTSSL